MLIRHLLKEIHTIQPSADLPPLLLLLLDCPAECSKGREGGEREAEGVCVMGEGRQGPLPQARNSLAINFDLDTVMTDLTL